MLKKLRRKFIIINLSLLALILLIVFTAVGISNYNQLSEDSELALMRVLEQNKGSSLNDFDRDFNDPPPEDLFSEGREKQPEAESPFTVIAAFSVTLNKDGDIEEIIGAENLSVTEELLASAVKEALESEKQDGYLAEYKLQFKMQDTANGTKIAFADRSSLESQMMSLVVTFVLVGAGALAAFFFISLFLANWVFRPVEQAWERQNQFVADASHELKSPLTVILANTKILMSHKDDTVENQIKWVEYIKAEAGRMKGLVDDLLLLAKSDAADMPVVSANVNLSDIVLGTVLPFESIAYEQGLLFHLEITPDLVIKGNESQLKQLVSILCDNACKYTGTSGSVFVLLSREQEKVILSVRNTGSTILPENLPHLFERFYRVDKSRSREQGGYGLGLSIAKRIVENHKGKISVKSAPEDGTVFRVTF